MNNFKLKKEFVNSLYYLLSADVDLIDALDIIKNLDKKKIYKVKKSLEKGNSILKSFSYISNENQFLIFFKYSDSTGNIINSLKLLKEEYEFSENLRKQIISLLIYPIIVILTSIILTTILLIFVVPQFVEIYNSSGIELPFSTNLIIKFSEFIKLYFIIIIFMIIINIFVFKYLIIKNKEIFDKYIIRIDLIRDILILKFSKNIYLLTNSNIDFVEALKLNNVNNLYFNQIIKKIIIKIEKGENISDTFKKEKIFPNDVVNYIKISENTGNIEKSFKNICTVYEFSIKNKINLYLKLFEPISILFISLIVGFITISIMMPLFNIGNIMYN